MNVIFRFVFCVMVIYGSVSYGQKNVAITIDDIPNTPRYQKDGFHTPLLDALDSLQIPITAFFNEGRIYRTDEVAANFTLLNNWAQRDYVTLGNHTFNHSRYSEAGFETFRTDVENGEFTLSELAKKYNKPLRHFRFPFNDLGKDSVQHVRIDSLLRSMGYRITPFTVESSDWMFNFIYEYYLDSGLSDLAAEIGELYVSKTMAYFRFFDSLSAEVYKRSVHQIYLCHDNPLNARYLPEIVDKLKREGYGFISLDEALEDSIYDQEDRYYYKWGVSWFYRWMHEQSGRVRWMRKEPDMQSVESLFENLQKTD